MRNYLLAIDQGTTNSRAIIFDRRGCLISQHEMALRQTFPRDGWVEQDPLEMFANTVECCRAALGKANLDADSLAAAGISNQRETTVIWDRITGKPVYPAIVWQDRRTSEMCRQLSKTFLQEMVYHKTGLLLDPYFSATKIVWILENVQGVRERAAKGDLLFGTVDTFLLWQLTHGKSHATDATNASRTLLFNIHDQTWDDEILRAFNIPAVMLPVVKDNTADFGDIHGSILGKSVPVTGMAGDQQAATIGQACFHSGMVKATYGTGCFMLLNTGDRVIQSNNKLLSTIAYRIDHHVTYGLEGSIFSAGETVKWLRDTLGLITHAAETEALAKKVHSTEGVYLIPAFTGLGAPYWDPDARGALLGLTRSSGREHVVRAALENVAYQTRDLLEAMKSDCHSGLNTLRVDGGMAANNWLLQFLSDILNLQVHRPVCIETTALGAAYLAGLQAGLYQSLDDISKMWQMSASFVSQMSKTERDKLYLGWRNAVNKVTRAGAFSLDQK
ncbi:Glycerol kinase [Aquicella siphonis]|uniref:Glycerol kinase n=1 Tax=Aquicella siphonis TaxID=254247 RepID=A0A5E4PLE0_9COXI|nr:glycerol kinase GlpK [Aquicella siphonis]VVC77046.1 Glycerol kinase [Aquicella siphonis]